MAREWTASDEDERSPQEIIDAQKAAEEAEEE